MKTIHDIPQDERYPFDIFKVNDGVTQHLHSDAHAGTVIKISKSGKRIVVQRDKATLKPEFKPEFIPGGFAGHCTNQANQDYTYERDLTGQTIGFSLRKWRGYYIWSYTGGYVDGHNMLSHGRHEFYDYNF